VRIVNLGDTFQKPAMLTDYHPLSEADWKKIARLYEHEEVSIPALAQRFHVTVERIRGGLAERGIPSKRKKQKCGDSASTN
jgi:hypothetical protein